MEEAQAGFTLAEIWAHSGFIARVVIFMLVAMFISTIFVTIERAIAFNRARSQSIALAGAIVTHLQKGSVDKALSVAKDEAYASSYLGALLRAGLGELSGTFDRNAVKASHRAVHKAEAEESAKLMRFMTILATVGSTAPFVGLFGTTFGVINAFQGMASAGSGLSSISAGISEALITTGVGIGVAVVGVWMFNYFNARIAKVREELDSSVRDFEDWTEKQFEERNRAAGK